MAHKLVILHSIQMPLHVGCHHGADADGVSLDDAYGTIGNLFGNWLGGRPSNYGQGNQPILGFQAMPPGDRCTIFFSLNLNSSEASF